MLNYKIMHCNVIFTKVAKKKLTLDAATEAFQFFSDCNETESVIKEFITLAKSKVKQMFGVF